MGTPDMLCFANEKLTIKTQIPETEVGRGHSLAIVFKGKLAIFLIQNGKNHNILYVPIKKSEELLFLKHKIIDVPMVPPLCPSLLVYYWINEFCSGVGFVVGHTLS